MFVDENREVLSEVFGIFKAFSAPWAVPECFDERWDVFGHGERDSGVTAHPREGDGDGGVAEPRHRVLQRVPLVHRVVARESTDGVAVRLAVSDAFELSLWKVHLERVVYRDAVW